MIEKQKKIPSPWTPVKAERLNNGCEIKVWGRTYKIENAPLFTSILTSGVEMLASPMRIVSQENGCDSVWTDSQVFLMQQDSDESATICATATSDSFYVNTAITVEFDGCVKLDIKLMPRGLSVREVFFGNEKKQEYSLDSLWLEIPLRKEVASLYQIFPRQDIILDDGSVKKGDFLSTGDFVPPGTTHIGERVGQFLLCNDSVGLGCFFESKQGWQPPENNYVECVNCEDEIVLRIRFLDSHPECWKHTNPQSDCDNFYPISFSVGLQTLPFKQFPKNPYTERNVHIDCFKKISSDYEHYLSSPFVYDDGTKTDEIVFDRLKRLGVNTLYLHEKWNTCQNSFWLTSESAERIEYIVKECHKRDIKVIPYFGYEISSLMPLYSEYADLVTNKGVNGNPKGFWNRVPYQRDAVVCYNSPWQDMFVDGIDRLMSKYNFDGIYLDGTASCNPLGCANEKHGCGYRDSDGNLHATYPFWAIRSLMKKLYAVVEKHGGIINCHTSAAYNLSALAFCHSIWEGEVAQYSLLKGEINEMPEGLFRSNLSGRLFGIPLYFLCYLNDPVWTFDHATAFSLLMGILPKTVDLDLPLEKMDKLWKAIGDFPVDQAIWHPFWEKGVIKTSDNRVKCSYYSFADRQLLAVVANTVKEEISAKITVDGSAKCKQLMLEMENVSNGSTFNFSPFGYRFFIIDID